MSAPKHLWSGDWMRESESAAEQMASRRRQEQPPAQPTDEPPAPRERKPAPRRRTAEPAFARARAAWGTLAATAVRWRVAAWSRLTSISPRQIGLTLLATVAGAAVALGAAALAGGSNNSPPASKPATSTSPRAWLGVQTTTSTSIPGATVELLDPGGPAQRAGVMPGDVITQVDGQPITSSGDLASALAAKAPGQQVQLAISRFGQMIVIDTTLGSRTHGVP